MNLYIFAIGGTGCRVLKSLTMLLASGVKLHKDVEKVVPIILDLDVRNGDRVRTIKMMQDYAKIKAQGLDNEGFFAQQIVTIDKVLTELDENHGFSFDFNEDKTFKEYLSYNQMDTDTKGVVDLLFEEEILNTNLTVGFKGFPNVGSVVLNKFTHSNLMKQFANQINAQDRIMIVSSIFGGTGASGFPLLLSSLRDTKQGAVFENLEKLNTVKIGAVSVMPYFKLNQDDMSLIDSNAFITKTITALSFYKDNIRDLNAMYYLGDENDATYSNVEGEGGQKNSAHFVELAAALAVVDFSEKSDSELSGRCLYNEFSLEKELKSKRFDYNHLSEKERKKIENPMNRFTLFGHLLAQYLDSKAVKQTNWYKILFKENEEMLSLMEIMKEFFMKPSDGYFSFIQEVQDNDKGFAPYNLNAEKCGALFNYNPRMKSNLFGKKQPMDIDDLNKCLNEEASTAQKQNPKFDLDRVLQVIEKASDKFLGIKS